MGRSIWRRYGRRIPSDVWIGMKLSICGYRKIYVKKLVKRQNHTVSLAYSGSARKIKGMGIFFWGQIVRFDIGIVLFWHKNNMSVGSGYDGGIVSLSNY